MSPAWLCSTIPRLFVLIGALLMAQAVSLWAGVSLWSVVLQGVENIIAKLTPLLGGL